MKKKVMMIVSIVLMSSATAFAGGAQDEDIQEYGPGNGRRDGGPRVLQGGFDGERMGGRFSDPSVCYDADGNEVQLEEISVEGALVLEEGTMPYLNTADGKVFLMVPRFMVYELELEGGEAVKVTGFDVPFSPWGEEYESTFLRVTDAEIDGKQIVLMGSPRRAAPGRDRAGRKEAR